MNKKNYIKKDNINNSKDKKHSFSFIDSIFIPLLSIFLSIFILLSIFNSLLYNYDFYNKEYNKTKVFEKYSPTLVKNITYSLFDYFKNKDEIINDEYNFFSLKDKSHLRDVKKIFKKINYLYNITFLILIILFILYIILYQKAHKIKYFINKIFFVLFISSLINILSIILLFILSLEYIFNFFFIKLHYLLFNNLDWILDQKYNKLTQLFKETFFLDFTKKLFETYIIYGIIIFLVSFITIKFILYDKDKTLKYNL